MLKHALLIVSALAVLSPLPALADRGDHDRGGRHYDRGDHKDRGRWDGRRDYDRRYHDRGRSRTYVSVNFGGPHYYHPRPYYYRPAYVYSPVPIVEREVIYINSEPAGLVSNDDGRYCREYQGTATVGGRPQQTYGTACMQPDGSWEIIS